MYANSEEMKIEHIPWLAGLLEGEGCFCFNRTPRVILCMTDEDIVARVATLWGAPYHKNKIHGTQKKVSFTTTIHGEKAILCMSTIRPFMGVRRSAKIDRVIEVARARPGIARGERCGAAKLSDGQAEAIRNAFVKGSRKVGERSSDLARRFGISQSALWYVINRRQPVGRGVR